MNLELIIDSKSTLGEGPSWDSNKEFLYWIDILEKKLHRYDPATRQNLTVQLDQYPGAIAPREEGEVVLALEKGFYFYNWLSEELDAITDPEADFPNNRFNDGKCDAQGRFWAGTMEHNESEDSQEQGSLYSLEPDLSVKRKQNHVTISNGIAWSPDHRYMYYIDTPTEQIVSYEFDSSTGEMKNPQQVVSFKKEKGFPDGMTSDEEGMLWIAHWGGAQVSRWNPSSGKKIDFISLPSPNVTSCVFGGKNLDELYVTTARKGIADADLQHYPHAGGLFKVQTKVRGMPTYSFKG